MKGGSWHFKMGCNSAYRSKWEPTNCFNSVLYSYFAFWVAICVFIAHVVELGWFEAILRILVFGYTICLVTLYVTLAYFDIGSRIGMWAIWAYGPQALFFAKFSKLVCYVKCFRGNIVKNKACSLYAYIAHMLIRDPIEELSIN